MNKSELYSWSVSPEVKNGLEAAAQAHKTSVAQLLDQLVSQRLDREEAGDDETQGQLRKAAMQTFGTIRGGYPLRSQQVRTTCNNAVRAKVKTPSAGPALHPRESSLH